MSNLSKSQMGITLIELLVTVSIVAITSAIALPSFGSLIQDSRQDAALRALHNGMQLTRSEAVKRGRRTVICASTNGTTCVGDDWTRGWIAFVDTNANGQKDSGEAPLRIGEGLDTGLSMVGSTNVALRVRYESDGDSLETGAITVCDPRGADMAEAIVISASGKPKLSQKGVGGSSLTCPSA